MSLPIIVPTLNRHFDALFHERGKDTVLGSPEPIGGLELASYFLGHTYEKDMFKTNPLTGNISRVEFFRLKKPLKAFKKLVTPYKNKNSVKNVVIANLVIPRGARVYADSFEYVNFCIHNNKIRVDMAEVHSMLELRWEGVAYNPKDVDIFTDIPIKKVPVWKAQSIRSNNKSFYYNTGKMVIPELPFSKDHLQCASGIHCFLNLREALAFNLY